MTIDEGGDRPGAPHLLRTDDRCDPLGIGWGPPVVSWRLADTGPGVTQAARHLQVASSPEALATAPDLWDSGEVADPAQSVRLTELSLPSRTIAYWRVRVRDRADRLGPWSEVARFETGLLEPGDWTADWITHPDWYEESNPRVGMGVPLPLFAADFAVPIGLRSARLYLAGVGVYVPTLNGAAVSDAVLEPPYTDVSRSIIYTAHDVTGLLRRGVNTIGIQLGPGIAHVLPHQDRYLKFHGSVLSPRLIAQLQMGFEDGTSRTIGSDHRWWTALGPTLNSHWYGGEDYDARREIVGWDTPEADRTGWIRALRVESGPIALMPRECPPIRVVEERGSEVSRAADGTAVFDVGSAVAGWPVLHLDLPQTTHLRLVPGDQLDRYGRVVQSNSTTGSPIYHTYVGRAGAQQWHPRFRYDGFRYLEVQGLPPDVGVGAVTAQVLRADNRRIGEFSTSDPLLNDIHRIIDRAVASNMYSVLTDCPHREKLGWLEQAHLLFDVVARGYDVAAYYRHLVEVMAQAQTPEGLVPDIAPEYVEFSGGFRDDPNWGRAIIGVPWQLYRWYGDTRTLKRHYDAMVAYLRYLHGKAQDDLLDHGLGDWIAPDGSTPVGVTATWGYHEAAAQLSRIARVLGRNADADGFAAAAWRIATAFAKRYVDPVTGRCGSGSQACDLLALDLGAVPAGQVESVLDRVCRSVRPPDGRPTVGEIVLPALFRVLRRHGRDDVLHTFATSTANPSYGYQVRYGATALTEAWDGPTRGLSQNHFMLGAIDSWFFTGLAGIDQTPDSIGFADLVIDPAIVGDLTSVSAATESAYGPVSVDWHRTEGELWLNVDVPPGSAATVRTPVHTEAGWCWDMSPEATPQASVPSAEPVVDCGRPAFAVDSGRWAFVGRATPKPR